MIRQTSLQAYHELSSKNHKAIIEALRLWPDSTDAELTRFMGYSDCNKIRPRRNELMRLGIVRESGRRQCTITGKTSLTWRIS